MNPDPQHLSPPKLQLPQLAKPDQKLNGKSPAGAVHRGQAWGAQSRAEKELRQIWADEKYPGQKGKALDFVLEFLTWDQILTIARTS